MEHQNLHPECGQKVTDCPTVPLLWLFHQEGPHPQTMTPGELFLNLEMLLLITGRQSLWTVAICALQKRSVKT